MSALSSYQDVPLLRPSPVARLLAWLRRVPPARMRSAELGLLAVITFGLGMAIACGV